MALPGAAFAQGKAPANLLPPESVPAAATPPALQPAPTVQPITPDVQRWSIADARALLQVVGGIGAEGLDPADYKPAELEAAIAGGHGEALDQVASRTFAWLVEDLRDGRTPMDARRQWFVVDPDADRYRTADVMAQALSSRTVAQTLASLHPEHPDYAALRAELANTQDAAKRKLIRANMDRWRWLAKDLGTQYLITNVPEYQLRLTVNDKIISTYKTIVGKPGRTATPQLAETVEGVIFNPTWTVPQSIVKGEGLGAKVLGNPGWAKAAGYKATRDPKSGFVTVVQQPGANNSLGLMKLDMPNPHAIFLHDTPSRNLFNAENRALSHGCIRTERAQELAITLAILGNLANTPETRKAAADEAVAISTSGKYTRVPIQKSMPVYITYFTMGRDIEGNLRTFSDIYGRDAPVLASFDKPRQENRARRTSEEAVEIVDDLQTI
ncbi:L,D-transpeptidase family protein [Altererythrobacter aerius]|uniref:L,D-transpeptidase family protein n=1 Tax=Tsuneonella aeria TaxID=1837929 RepID=A0A6I4TEH6_9SPHN|nr:L,D-transpeptidase family protein [Tsuneonella aeria]MXO74986.1 L,D-transpeptidase family protein [Tsuneonella aeria]